MKFFTKDLNTSLTSILALVKVAIQQFLVLCLVIYSFSAFSADSPPASTEDHDLAKLIKELENSPDEEFTASILTELPIFLNLEPYRQLGSKEGRVYSLPSSPPGKVSLPMKLLAVYKQLWIEGIHFQENQKVSGTRVLEILENQGLDKINQDQFNRGVQKTKQMNQEAKTELNRRKESHERKEDRQETALDHQQNIDHIDNRYESHFKGMVKTAPVAVAAILATVGGGYLIKHILDRVFVPGIPQVIDETSLAPNFTRTGFKNPEFHKGRKEDMIYGKELQDYLNRLKRNTDMAIKHHQPLSNALFYGPPGTGKTLFAKELARHSNSHYLITSASNFLQLSPSKALQEFKKIMQLIKKVKKPVIVFFDEADSLFGSNTALARDITNLFLSEVPKAHSKKYMFIFSTNKAFSLRDAILDRIGQSNQIHFDLPGVEEIKKLLQIYIGKTLKEVKIRAAKDMASTGPAIHQIAEQLVSIDMSGRQVEQFSLDLYYFLAARPQLRELKAGMLKIFVDEFMKKRDQMISERKRALALETFSSR